MALSRNNHPARGPSSFSRRRFQGCRAGSTRPRGSPACRRRTPRAIAPRDEQREHVGPPRCVPGARLLGPQARGAKPSVGASGGNDPARAKARGRSPDQLRDVRHLLDRFAFGPRPGEIDAVLEQGTRAWFEHQLRAAELPDPRAERTIFPTDARWRRLIVCPTSSRRGGVDLDSVEAENPRAMSKALRKQVAVPRMLQELQIVEARPTHRE